MLLHNIAYSLAVVSVFGFFGLCLLLVCALGFVVFGDMFKLYFYLVRSSLK